MSRFRSTLIALNTVDRLLRGDFFHTVSLEEVLAELRGFPPKWPVSGLGTTNWYRRNGEIVIEGTAGTPSFLWADPGAGAPGRILDLQTDRPEHADELTTPSMTDDEREPRMPFVAIGVGDPDRTQTIEFAPGDDVHAAIQRACDDANIGLAALMLEGELQSADYEEASHIPLGGASSFDALGKEHGRAEGERWRVSGLFAANPTVQNIISVLGRPVHLHGRSVDSNVGGHIVSATRGAALTAELWPLQDLVMRIRDLDTAWLPIRDVAAEDRS
jgi:hypothetical protein